ncbi:hypothetical protein THIX_60980 [Thiomonas sp. X19]|uniref:hypothetical protein n=1 Tax=Thiomonas sp. X19 TaxID=1050370 RepID=UPI000B6CCD9A|nr:hypothetical protein [Thiomonas sp. X19]SCC94922.1 hypothetical protein THIX_60980 [Thiomonas sp. X19]
MGYAQRHSNRRQAFSFLILGSVAIYATLTLATNPLFPAKDRAVAAILAQAKAYSLFPAQWGQGGLYQATAGGVTAQASQAQVSAALAQIKTTPLATIWTDRSFMPARILELWIFIFPVMSISLSGAILWAWHKWRTRQRANEKHVRGAKIEDWRK